MKFITTAISVLMGLNSMAQTSKPDLIIATDGAFPPYTFVNEKGDLDGFETELIKRACQQENLTCQFVYKGLQFGDLLPGVEAGKWDVAFGGIGSTDQRLLKFDFVINYQAEKYFFGRSGLGIASIPNDLSGLKAGGEKGTQFLSYLQLLSDYLVDQGQAPITILSYDSTDEVKLALKNADIDVAPMGTAIIDLWKQEGGFEAFSIQGPEIISGFKGSSFGAGDGFVFSKANRLQYLINSAVQRMLFDCQYADLELQYIGFYNAMTPAHCRP